jgi:hypothetical protein
VNAGPCDGFGVIVFRGAELPLALQEKPEVLIEFRQLQRIIPVAGILPHQRFVDGDVLAKIFSGLLRLFLDVQRQREIIVNAG